MAEMHTLLQNYAPSSYRIPLPHSCLLFLIPYWYSDTFRDLLDSFEGHPLLKILTR